MSASSTETTPATDQGAVTTEQVEPQVKGSDDKASSSDAPQAKSMLEAVQTALKPKDAPPASQTPGPDKTETQDPDKPASDPAAEEEPSEEDKKHWSQRTARSFQRLTSQLRGERQKVTDLSPKAEEYDKLDTFVRNAGLSPDNIKWALQTAVLLRHDPRAAYDALVPVMQQLDGAVGNVLPQDLQQRVQQGYLTEQDARAMSRASADAALSRQILSERAAQQQHFEQMSQLQTQFDQSQSVIENWEKAKSTDPDWHLKQAEVAEQVELAFERERRDRRDPRWFPNPSEAVQMANQAYERVNTRMKRFAPRPTEIRPTTTDSAASMRSSAEPKTMFEAIKMAVAAR